MSIVQEALKKAGDRVMKPGSTPPAAPSGQAGASAQAQRQIPAPKRSASAGHDPRAVAILLVLLVVTALFAAKEIFLRRTTQSIPAAKATPQRNAGAQSIRKAVLFAPQAAWLFNPELTLNGIMYLEDEPRAIINNEMVGLSDAVNGAIVVKIDRRSVLLQRNDEEIKLDLK